MDAKQVVLSARPGDVLLSAGALPTPDLMLQGFRKFRGGRQFEPYVDFRQIQKFLEFLEHVVLCERLIVPITRYSRETDKLIRGKRSWMDFAVFRAAGDLNYSDTDVARALENAGVLVYAGIEVGESTADEVVAKHLPRSRWMRERFAYYSGLPPITQSTNKLHMGNAHMAAHIGAPLHMAEAAGITKVPFILSPYEAKELSGFEAETLHVRRSVTQLLLDRLNRGAKKEIEKLAEFGPVSMFPETPIARLIVEKASNPSGLVDGALQLRSELAPFRRAMNQLESDLACDAQPLSLRLKRLRELQTLADSIWKDTKTDLRTNALSISEAFFAIPETMASPAPSSLKSLVNTLLALPVERVVQIYKQRKLRLVLRAKRRFLRTNDTTVKLARILGVSEDIARRSRNLDRPLLTKRYSKANPDDAARYYAERRPYQPGSN